MCYLHETTTKMKACYKHMILLTIKAHLTGKVLWNFESNYQQKLEQVETKNKKFCRHDLTEVVIFFLQNKNRLHSATVVQFPFGQPSHKSFCRHAGLC